MIWEFEDLKIIAQFQYRITGVSHTRTASLILAREKITTPLSTFYLSKAFQPCGFKSCRLPPREISLQPSSASVT